MCVCVELCDVFREIIVHVLIILQNNKDARYMYYNNSCVQVMISCVKIEIPQNGRLEAACLSKCRD